jgi:DNA-binding Lrp family transcriptional regulator
MSDVDLDYTGVHAFVFINQVHPALDVGTGQLKGPESDGSTIRDVIDALRSFGPPPDGPVIFAAELVGSAKGFAHLRADTLADLQDFIGGQLSRRGITSDYSTEADVAKVAGRKKGAKRSTPEVIALVRIKVEKGRLRDVLRDLADEHGPLRRTFKGASVVFGNYDILLQLGGDEFDDVADAVYGPLQEIDGIASTNTAFTDARRYGD